MEWALEVVGGERNPRFDSFISKSASQELSPSSLHPYRPQGKDYTTWKSQGGKQNSSKKEINVIRKINNDKGSEYVP